MCGICGIVYLDGTPAQREEVAPMVDTLLHRGPDQGAILVDGACAFGNRRIAVQDLTSSGDLPMRSADSRQMLTYDGEIYNHPQIRQNLEAEGLRYRGNSDAETLLKLYRRYGVELMRTLRGMFAFALWDRETQTLLVARDRMGEKPLYYYTDGRVFVFASEIKALLAHPAVPRESALDAHTLALYMAYGYIPAPDTAFKGIKTLLPAHRIEIKQSASINPVRYWTLPLPVGVEQVSPAREREKGGSLGENIGEAVRQSLIGDVPLGVFLSGGLDSSVIVALMRRHNSGGRIRTFSLGFEGDGDGDTRYARHIADYLHTEHTAFTVAPQAVDLLPTLVWHHDQPFADTSAIPMYLLSKLARDHITVALTGTGGDAVFAGYNSFTTMQMIQRLNMMPRGMWNVLARTLGHTPSGSADRAIGRMRLLAQCAALTPALAYLDLMRLFDARLAADLSPDVTGHASQHFTELCGGEQIDLPGLLRVNMNTYLPDDLLLKADRASMAASLETRAPLLDHWLVEFAATVPLNLKLKGSTTKYLLKQIAGSLLPPEVINRPRRKLDVPVGAWLRREAPQLRETLLSPEARGRGLFHQEAVEGLIDDHMSGRRDHGQRLWSLLTLEWWHRLFIDPPTLRVP